MVIGCLTNCSVFMQGLKSLALIKRI